MASRKDNSISINKYKRKREMNIGIFIFAIVFIYLIVTIVMYAAAKKISVYEVREGSILTDNSYTGSSSVRKQWFMQRTQVYQLFSKREQQD